MFTPGVRFTLVTEDTLPAKRTAEIYTENIGKNIGENIGPCQPNVQREYRTPCQPNQYLQYRTPCQPNRTAEMYTENIGHLANQI